MSQANPTQKEVEDYAQAYVLGDAKGDQSKSWRTAFPKSKASENSVWQLASKFHSIIEVQSRIKELSTSAQERAVDKFNVTVDSLICELEEVRGAALAAGQYSPSVSAIMGKAKLAGLDVDKVEISGADMSPWNSIKGD
jgi:hypothetical protein